MGLLDVLNGMKNGPRGPSKPGEKGGMSPIMMAILAYLAYKGIKHVSGGAQTAPAGSPRIPAPGPTGPGTGGGRTMEAQAGGGLDDLLGGLLGGGRSAPSGRSMQTSGGGLDDLLGGLLGGGRGGAPSGGGMGGGMGDLLKGGLGGLLAGGAAGSILSGGLGGLLEQFQQNGQGQAAASWVGRGQNEDISESDLARSIGADDIDALSRHFGIAREDLLSGLRRELPGAIDELTPEGRLPTQDELSKWV